MVWELEAGSPNHQVLRFQRMAAISRAKTMAKPAPELTCKISSTGSRVMTVKATVPEEVSTPARLHMPDQTTAMLGSQRVRVDDRGHGVGGVVEAVDKLKAQGDEQGDSQQQIGPDGAEGHAAEILGDLKPMKPRPIISAARKTRR